MITIQQIFSNISSYQTGIPVKQIYAHLNKFYDSIKHNIQINKAEFQNGGTNIYLKIPASNIPAFYDVVLWVKNQTKIKNTNEFKIYSNSPNFGYTFAYLYNKQRSLLFPTYYPNKILNNPPNVKNPLKVITFDKHTYVSLKHISKRDLSELVEKTKSLTPDIKKFIDKEKELLTFRRK